MHTADRLLRELAEPQYLVVGRWQAQKAGLDSADLKHLLRHGGWEKRGPRVLRLVGSLADERQDAMAATLDGGPEAGAARRTAAPLWQLPGFPFGPLEVARPRTASATPTTLGTLLEPRLLLPSHFTTIRGIPVTTLPVTIYQLAGVIHPDRLARLVHTVVARSPGVLSALHDLLPELAARGRNGITAMRAVLEELPRGSTPFGSGTERRLHQILVAAGEKPLRRQVDLGGHEWLGRVDVVDDDLGFITEVDSETYHSSPMDRANDARRDEALLALGFVYVLRISEEEIWQRPNEAVDRVRATRRWIRDGRPGSGPTFGA